MWPTSPLVLLSLILFAKAQFPRSSSYYDKCSFDRKSNTRLYHKKEGPVGPTHKAYIICGTYPTTADFIPIPNVQNADECALGCKGTCEGVTWSEVIGTEFKCHTFENWDKSYDETGAHIMAIAPPLQASAKDQMSWACSTPYDPTAGPVQKYHPPNLELRYYCDTTPQTQAHVYRAEPLVADPDSCVLACKSYKDTYGVCSGALWYSDASPHCYTIVGDDGGMAPRSGSMYMTYVEHQLPSVP